MIIRGKLFLASLALTVTAAGAITKVATDADRELYGYGDDDIPEDEPATNDVIPRDNFHTFGFKRISNNNNGGSMEKKDAPGPSPPSKLKKIGSPKKKKAKNKTTGGKGEEPAQQLDKIMNNRWNGDGHTDSPSGEPSQKPSLGRRTPAPIEPSGGATKWGWGGDAWHSPAPTDRPTPWNGDEWGTAEPSEEPSEAPTEWEGDSWTAPPTDEPTEWTAPPTDDPTKSPTEDPSGVPSEAPTEWDGDSWDAPPTDPPTIWGGDEWTAPPTDEPSEAPTEKWGGDSHVVQPRIWQGDGHNKCKQAERDWCCLQNKDYVPYWKRVDICLDLGCNYKKCNFFDTDDPTDKPTEAPTHKWKNDGHDGSSEEDEDEERDRCQTHERDACCTQDDVIPHHYQGMVCDALGCNLKKCFKREWSSDGSGSEDEPEKRSDMWGGDEWATAKPSAAPSTWGDDGWKTATEDPTGKPTASPTRNPTRKPTWKPSWSPSKRPIKKPTRKPTWKPSWSPSKSPTRKPTRNPTKSPVWKSSWSPSASPSEKKWNGDGHDRSDSDDVSDTGDHLDQSYSADDGTSKCTGDERDTCCGQDEQFPTRSLNARMEVCKMLGCNWKKCAKRGSSSSEDEHEDVVDPGYGNGGGYGYVKPVDPGYGNNGGGYNGKKPTDNPTKLPTKKPTGGYGNGGGYGTPSTKEPTKKPTGGGYGYYTKKPTNRPSKSPTDKPTYAKPTNGGGGYGPGNNNNGDDHDYGDDIDRTSPPDFYPDSHYRRTITEDCQEMRMDRDNARVCIKVCVTLTKISDGEHVLDEHHDEREEECAEGVEGMNKRQQRNQNND